MDANLVHPAWSPEEQTLRSKFGPNVAGVDEAGRGPLAGPIVAAAVVLPDTPIPRGLADSKSLSAARREALAEALHTTPGVRIGVGVVSAEEIDRLDILRAVWLAMRLAIQDLDPLPDCALIDGLPVPAAELPVPSSSRPKADRDCLCVAAASIIAKVTRDRIMVEMDRRYPGYGFTQHKGYGTRRHLEALNRLGPCPIHRRSFGPVARTLSDAPKQLLLGIEPPPRTTTPDTPPDRQP